MQTVYTVLVLNTSTNQERFVGVYSHVNKASEKIAALNLSKNEKARWVVSTLDK